MRKTAMQELMDWADSFPQNHQCSYLEFAEKCADMLEIEKQQHRQSFEFGVRTLSVYRSKVQERRKGIFETYYTQTFTQ